MAEPEPDLSEFYDENGKPLEKNILDFINKVNNLCKVSILDIDDTNSFRLFIINENLKLPLEGTTDEGYKYRIERCPDSIHLNGYIEIPREIKEKYGTKIITSTCTHHEVTGGIDNHFGFDCAHHDDLININDIFRGRIKYWIDYKTFIENDKFNGASSIKEAFDEGYKDINYVIDKLKLWSIRIQEKINQIDTML